MNHQSSSGMLTLNLAEPIYQPPGKYPLHHPKHKSNKPTYKYISKRKPITHKTTFFSLLFIGTLAEKKQDTPHQKSVPFHPVLKVYPT